MTKARDIADLGDSIINDGNDNVALGDGALDDASLSGSNNVAIGEDALGANTTASRNTAVGYQAGYNNTTGQFNVLMGYRAGYRNTGAGSIGDANVFLGYQAGLDNQANNNVGIGNGSMSSNTSGAFNVAVGQGSLSSNTTAAYNAAFGVGALNSNTTGAQNTAMGYTAGNSNTTGEKQTFIGNSAGLNTTASQNTFVGQSSGTYVTTGASNTIIGRFNGNENGLDIRTSSNNIVLSDGDGNPRVRISDDGDMMLGKAAASDTTGITFLDNISGYANSCGRIILNSGNSSSLNTIVFQYNGSQVGYIQQTTTAVSYNTSSDHRLKENVVELTGATDRLKQLEPKRFNFIADADTTVDGFLAHEVQSVVPEAITGTHNEVDADGNPVYQGIDQAKLVPLLVATIKELEARITALEAN